MYKIITVLGTRPEIIKLSLTIPKLDKYFNHKLVHTGQNYDYELNDIFFKDLNIRKPDYFLNTQSSTAIENIANIFIKFEEIIKIEKPDAIVILGDTNSALVSIVGYKKKITIFHLEAGNRCFNRNTPEELNRKLVDHSSDLNLVYTDIAKFNLLREGISSEYIIKTGSPMLEIINHYKSRILKSKIMNKIKLEKKNYILVSFHREENVDDKEILKELFKILILLAKKFNKKIVFSTHARTKKNINIFNLEKPKEILFLNSFSFTDYIFLQKNSFLVMSDSGTITEESSILSFDAINLRDSTERLEGMEEGSVIMTGLNYKKILSSIKILKSIKKSSNLVKDYNVSNFSEKIIKIILSYLDK